MSFPTQLPDQISDLVRRIRELETRISNRRRTGTIKALDLAKGLARVEFEGGDRPYVGPWIPWKEVAAGGIKTHIPPTVGEQVDVVSENGELSDGIIDMSTPSNANPRPHDGPEGVITMGDVRITIADGQATVKGPVVLVDSPDVRLGGEGGKPVARLGDKVNVGSGSSAGLWPIVEGSATVTAVD